jgi:hypothetical protein
VSRIGINLADHCQGTGVVVSVETSWVVKDVLWLFSRLGGIVVSMLATEPKGCGFEPGQGDGFKSHRDE